MIRLSQALVRLNKAPDACTALHEIDRRYPRTPAATKARAAEVRKQAQCER